MGWSSGTELMREIIHGLKKSGVVNRSAVYKVLIPAFENQDCDTLYECCDSDIQFKRTFEKMYPPEAED